MFVPVFFVICAAGLYVLAERERGTAFDILTARVGNSAARVGVALQSAVDQGGVTRAAGQLHQHLIDTLLADNAIICAEFRSDRSGSVQLVSPFGVGCRGAAEGQLFRMETADEGQGELRVRFSTKEVEDAVRSRRELSLGILIGGLLIGLLASAVGFRIFIGRPLNRLLDAVREAPDSGTHEAVPVEGNDEIADVTNAYNTLQSRIADFSDRLEERVKERTFVAEMAAADARLANDELQKEVAVREEAQRDLRANAVKLQQQQIALNKLIREGILIGPKWRSAIRQITEICVATLDVQSCGVWFFSAYI
jgi:methyl-accepting chemotaxis protein